MSLKSSWAPPVHLHLSADMRAKTILFLSASVLSAACSTPIPTSTSVETLTQSISFFTPVNDLLPEQQFSERVQTTKNIQVGENLLFVAPLTRAVECNKDKTACKHAVIKTWMEYKVQSQTEQNVLVTGVLHSEMGRSLSVKAKTAGYSQEETQTIPESVPLIDEYKSDSPFKRNLKLGEVLEISGFAGAKVTIKFQ